MSAVLPKVDTLSICEICIKKKTWRVSLSIGVRTTMISWVFYLLRIFKMFHGLMNNPVFLILRICQRDKTKNVQKSACKVSLILVRLQWNLNYCDRFSKNTGITFLFNFVLWPTNAQLLHELSHSYMFRHYHVILRQLVINTLLSYTSIANAAFGNTVYNYDVSRRLYASSHTIVVEISVL